MYPFIGKAWCCPFFCSWVHQAYLGKAMRDLEKLSSTAELSCILQLTLLVWSWSFDFPFVRLLCLISQFSTERAESGKSDYHFLQLQQSPCLTLSDSAHTITCLCPDVCVFSYARLYWASSFWFSSVSLPVMPSSNLCCEPTYYSGLIAINS